MVEMIPELISPSIKSGAERSLFASFKEFKSCESYIILHSLGLAEHVNNIFGEIDFVVICTQGVLCVEVKGGTVSCTHGVWEFENRYGKKDSKTEGPFLQVQGNMQSLRKHIIKRVGNKDPLALCQYASCVIMPECVFAYEDPSVIQEILFDKTNYHNLEDTTGRSFKYWRDKLRIQHGFEGGTLTEQEMKRLANLLRGDFHFVPSMKDTVDVTTKALCVLTDEQYDVLESLSDNDRTLVSGVAGAGKTLLAMEQARRMYWEGKEALYVCFNRNIASYVQYQFEKEGIEVKTSTLHSLMGEGPIEQPTTEYFEKILPSRFLSTPQVKQYDYLIIDEGQDLFRDAYLPCLDKMLKGGLAAGQWLFFYDQNQNVYNDNDQLESCLSLLKKYGAASFRLNINCRNTRQIADANSLTTGFKNIGRPKVAGLSVKYIPYSDKREEHRAIEEVIKRLRDEGLIGCDYIILSRYSLTNPLNCLHDVPLSSNIGTLKTGGQIWKAKKNEVRFSTISAFKGLEAKAVILIDVDNFSAASARLLNYVAISRACALLYILYDEKRESERQNMLLTGFLNI